LAFNVRDEYAWTDRTSFYGQLGYLRDTKKAIEYLVAPTAGLAYKLINLAPTKLNIDAGAGVVWERNTGLDTDTSGALTLGQSFSHQLTGTATLTQSLKGLWKTSDFGDTLYTVAIGLAASITERVQLKVEFLELYKSQPPPDIEKGDVSFITSVVYSF
jgi:putative salt-induced outer membrane protein YdiY